MSIDTTQLAIRIAEIFSEAGVNPGYEAITVLGRITTVLAAAIADQIDPTDPRPQAVLRAIHDVATSYHTQNLRETLWN